MKQKNKLLRLTIAVCFSMLTAGAAAAQLDATLQWANRVEISTPVTGVIREVLVNTGQRVDKSEKLLQLDDKVFRARVESATTALKSQEEQYQEAKREMERAQELYSRTVLSDHDLQVAKNKHIMALAERDKARYQLTRARYDLDYSTLRAPFRAIILQTLAQPGMVVNSEFAPQTLLVLAQADQMLARVAVDEGMLARVKPGQAAKVIVNGTTYEGVVKSIGFEPVDAAQNKALFPVDVAFNTRGTEMRAGQSAHVELP